MEFVHVHRDYRSENRSGKDGRAEGGCQVFRREDRSEVVRIHAGVALTPLFKVDIPSSSQSIGLGAQATRTETNNHIEGVKVLRPPGLPPGKEFGGGEIL